MGRGHGVCSKCGKPGHRRTTCTDGISENDPDEVFDGGKTEDDEAEPAEDEDDRAAPGKGRRMSSVEFSIVKDMRSQGKNAMEIFAEMDFTIGEINRAIASTNYKAYIG